jgi:2-polyprenyl-3-methyl-5-hydroxy-6-metoxy-1,4-benzoquinol methylase
MFSEDQIKSLIDYFITHQPRNWVPVAVAFSALAAMVAAAISLRAFRISRAQLAVNHEQLQTALRHNIRNEWNGLMDACIKEGKFIDPTFTHQYYAHPHADTLSYEAFCYRAWSLVDFIVTHKLQDENLYSAIISWIVAFHRTWLERNPFMFASKGFWRTYDLARAKPLMVLQRNAMPRRSGQITADHTDSVNWDEVSKEYNKWVLGPWAPEMMMRDPKKNNQRPNFLLDELLKYQTKSRKDQLRILDFGCGPGNILRYLAETNIKRIAGLDNSAAALEIAASEASKWGIDFEPVPADMRTFTTDKPFDVIISTNSILPERPEDIQKMFQTLFKNLKDDGRLFLILPTFDACTALLGYWKEHYRKTWDDDKFVQRCSDAFERAKMMDRDTRRFADDGEHQQTFHNKESIRSDLTACKFEIVGDIRKIKYPWDYAAKHDYGNFPDKPKIWDWYVEAIKKPAGSQTGETEPATT